MSGRFDKALAIAFGARLRELRVERNLTQSKIEKRTGLQRNWISRVEGGYHTPRVEAIVKLAEALDVPLGDLFPRVHSTPENIAYLKKLRTFELSAEEKKKLVKIIRSMER